MAEAIAGLSLAANILQMVEYGGVFVTTAWKIYSSQADSQLVKDFDQLRYLTQDFKDIMGSLQQNDSVNSNEALPKRNRDLLKLAAESRKISEEILGSLNEIGNPTAWRVKKHKIIQASFKLTWNQGHIAELQTKLDRVRSQLTLHLLHSLRSDAAKSQETQQEILGKLAQDTENLNNRIDQVLDLGLGTISVDFITQKMGGVRAENVGESLQSAMLGAIYEPERRGSTIEPKTLNVPLLRKQTFKEKLLSKLAYPDMWGREQSINKAHEETFQWIFQREKEQDRPWASFCQWLEEPDKQLYWITGKAGSGKSTLMRFVSEPLASGNASTQPENADDKSRCSSFLQRWAGSQPLIIACFYFWTAGSTMQRSREGMLRTLIHELLKQAEPDIIASVMPKSWEALCLFDEDPRPYPEAMLQEMLSRALQFMSASTRICIFIDGLDEFQGEHGDLIGIFRAALDAHPIKLCISSRPWQVFEDAFQDKPSLRLQDLTLPDIKAYIHSTLHPDPAFVLLRALEPSFADNLVDNIATKADGVFLWVYLVVASLQKGIKAGDRISDLERRLDELPRDLEGLYERILDDLDPEFLDHAMQHFQLMEASLSISPPNVMVFAYADEEDESFAINLPLSTLDKSTYENTKDVLKKRLNSRCMGLLEIAEQSTAYTHAFIEASISKVKYLHRTVQDYITSPSVKERLSLRASRLHHKRFDPHLRLCSAQLAFYKSSLVHCEQDPLPLHEDFRQFSNVPLSSCLSHAAKVQGTGSPSMVRLIDALRAVCSEDCLRYAYHQQDLRREVFTSGIGGDELVGPIWWKYSTKHWSKERLFTSVVIHHCVVEYIRAKIQPLPRIMSPPRTNGKMKFNLLLKRVFSRHHGESAGNIAITSDLDWQLSEATMTISPCLPMIQLLLEKGANPQYEYQTNDSERENGSIWEFALATYMIMFGEESRQEDWEEMQQEEWGTAWEEWEDLVRLMVKNGAPLSRGSIKNALRVSEILYRRVRVRNEGFCATVENHLKLIKEGA